MTADPAVLPDAYNVREASPRERRIIHVRYDRCANHITLQRVWNALLDAGYLDGVYSEVMVKFDEKEPSGYVRLCTIEANDPAGHQRQFIFLGGIPGQSSSCELSTNVTDEELEQQVKLFTFNRVVDESSTPT